MVVSRELLSELDDSDVESVDTDNVSLTSTVGSDQDTEYPVERILTERPGTVKIDPATGERRPAQVFLIKWEGYPLMRSTWEPEANFIGGVEDTLLTWRSDQKREQTGFSEPFPLQNFLTKYRRQKDRDHRRHARRRRKRQRAGYSPGSPSEASFDGVLPDVEGDSSIMSRAKQMEAANLFVEDDSDSEDDVPLVKRQRTSASKQAKTSQRAAVELPETSKPQSSTHESQRKNSKTQSAEADKPTPKPVSHINSTGNGYFAMTSALVKNPSTANMMKTSGPSKTTTKKPAANKGKQPVVGASIFSNWDKTKDKRSKSFTATEMDGSGSKRRLAPSLQVRNYIQKASTREKAPVHMPQLMDPSSGQILNPEAYPQVPMPSPQAPTQSTQAANAFPNSKGEATSSKVSTDRGPLYTCWFWKNRSCDKGNNCTFEHYDTGYPPPLKNMLSTNEMTCSFWAFSNCSKPEERCLYSHKPTNYIGPKPGQPPERYDRVVERQSGAQRGSHDTRTMCHFWFYGDRCQKPAGSCKFAHEITDGRVAGNPLAGEGYKYIKPSNEELEFRAALIPDARATRVPVEDEYANVPMEIDRSSTSPLPPPPPPPAHDTVPPPPPSPSPPPSDLESTAFRPIPPKSDHDKTIKSSVSSTQQAFDPLYTRSESSQPMPLISYTDENILNGRLLVQAGPNTVELNVRFLCTKKKTRSDLNAELGESATLTIQNICILEDFKRYINLRRYKIYGFGDLLPDDQGKEELLKVADHLTLHSACAIYFHKTFNLIIYPVHPSWRFLDPKTPSTNVHLQFHILSPFPPPLSRDAAKDEGTSETEAMKELVSAVSQDIETTSVESSFTRGLDVSRLFRWNDKEDGTAKAAYLMFDLQTYKHDLEELAAFLQKRNIEVYDNRQGGSWDAFTSNHTSGVVIFDPDFCSYHRIPKLLAKISELFNFFQFEHLGTKSAPPTPGTVISKPLSPYWPTRLFPTGRCIFITDDCFIDHPTETLKVVASVVRRLQSAPNATRLIGRPGLVDWLQELAEGGITMDDFGRTVESDTLGDLLRIRDKLISSLHSDSAFLETATLASARTSSVSTLQRNPTRRSPIYYLPSEVMPEYTSLSQSNPKAATSKIVNWFMGYSCMWEQVRHFRRFYIVTMADTKTKGEWRKNWKMGEIVTPIEYLREEEKKRKKP